MREGLAEETLEGDSFVRSLRNCWTSISRPFAKLLGDEEKERVEGEERGARTNTTNRMFIKNIEEVKEKKQKGKQEERRREGSRLQPLLELHGDFSKEGQIATRVLKKKIEWRV